MRFSGIFYKFLWYKIDLSHYIEGNLPHPLPIERFVDIKIEEGNENLNAHEGIKHYNYQIFDQLGNNLSNEGNKIFKCDLCNKCFDEKRNLRRHKNKVHGEKKHKCETCGKAFSSTTELKRHVNSVHEGIKEYQCGSCEKAFSRPQHLKV